MKKWQTRGDDKKSIIKNQKKHGKCEIRKQLGVIEDQPKQGGGSSNEGNCVRAFSETICYLLKLLD